MEEGGRAQWAAAPAADFGTAGGQGGGVERGVSEVMDEGEVGVGL